MIRVKTLTTPVKTLNKINIMTRPYGIFKFRDKLKTCVVILFTNVKIKGVEIFIQENKKK